MMGKVSALGRGLTQLGLEVRAIFLRISEEPVRTGWKATSIETNQRSNLLIYTTST